MGPRPWGLTNLAGDKPIDLQGVNVEARIVDFAAEVTIVQSYVNATGIACDVKFNFPVDERAAIFGLEVKIGDVVTVADIQAKQQARETYERAIAQGDSAQLLEQVTGDIFSMRVGNLPVNEPCIVTIKYVCDLKVDDEAVQFFLPVAVAPRYSPAACAAGAALAASKDSSLAAGGKGLHVTLQLYMSTAITAVTSESHKVRLTPGAAEGRGVVTLDQQYTHLEKDLVVLVATDDATEPRVAVERAADGSTVAMLSLVPRLSLVVADKCEFVFLVDRSGSMAAPPGAPESKSKMNSARSALQLFLRSLPSDCYFNIVGFGSSHAAMAGEPLRYAAQDSLQRATQYVAAMQANMGGTEILAPLQDILPKPAPAAGYVRQVFVLTDGEVSNTTDVIRYVGQNAGTARVFGLGLGDNASHELVEGIARAGRGTAAFVSSDDSLRRKVVQQLEEAMRPALTDVTLAWKTRPGRASEAFQTPAVVPPIFSKMRLVVFYVMPPGEVLTRVVFRAKTLEGIIETAAMPDAEVLEGTMLHTLAGRSQIRELEYAPPAPARDAQLLALSLQHHVASSAASFVAVQRRADGTHVPLDAILPPVPEPARAPPMMAAMAMLGPDPMAACAVPKARMPAEPRQRTAAEVAARQRGAAPNDASVNPRLPSTLHAHELVLVDPYGREWRCNYCSKKEKTKVFCCGSGCDFKLCLTCGPSTARTSGDRFQGAAHLHALTLSENPYTEHGREWRCGKCTAQGTWKVYHCEKCDFDLCLSCAATGAFEGLVLLQQFNGHFPLDELCNYLQRPVAAVTAARPAEVQGAAADDVWATALAVAVLRSRFAARQDMWVLMVTKAEEWIAAQVGAGVLASVSAAAVAFFN